MDDESIRELRSAAECAGLSMEFAELLADAKRDRRLRAERFMARVRRDALEEAANLCEARALSNLQLCSVVHQAANEMLKARDAEAQWCAAAIRALATAPTTEEQR